MKLKYDTSTDKGKRQVMEEYETNPGPLLIRSKNGNGPMETWREWHGCNVIDPLWNWELNEYNYSAGPSYVKWDMHTIPRFAAGGLWVRWKDSKQEHLISIVNPHGVVINGLDVSYSRLLNEAIHTVHCGNAWLPCGTLEA